MTAFIPEFIETRKMLAKAKGQSLRFRRPSKALIPQGIERKYRSDLLRIVRALRKEINNTLLPELPRIVAEANLRSDSLVVDGFVDILEAVVGPITARLDLRLVSQTEELVQRYFNETNNHNKRQLIKQIRTSLGVDAFPPEPQLADLMASFKAENRSLIKSLTDDTINGITDSVQRGVRAGQRPSAIAAEIRKKFKLSEKRAALIARDQVNKLNGQLTRMRQTNLGITEYIWRTSRDERVRSSHAALEGKKFSWDKGPPIGHPGQPINCRCTAEPVIEGIPNQP